MHTCVKEIWKRLFATRRSKWFGVFCQWGRKYSYEWTSEEPSPGYIHLADSPFLTKDSMCAYYTNFIIYQHGFWFVFCYHVFGSYGEKF